VDVQSLGCDFFMFSAHKLYGPTGFGVLYGRKEILSGLNPYQGGGGIIDTVTFEKTTFIDAPFRFEPGTPHIEGAIGLHAAIEYVENLGLSKIAEHENVLTDKLYRKLQDIPQVQIYGPRFNRSAIVSFNVKDAHPSDVGSLLDGYGIAVRTGHHCTQPFMRQLKVPGTVRASFGVYNTEDEIDFFVESLLKVINILKV
jgi:cysteine desulfurase/selenocysteine lyase